MIPIIQITITFNHHIIFFIETYLIIQKSFDLEKIWFPKLNQIFYKGHNSKMGILLKVFAIPSLSHTFHSFWECVWAMTCIGLILNSFISSYFNDVRYSKLIKFHLQFTYVKWEKKKCVIVHT
jgi:hypothetical protein